MKINIKNCIPVLVLSLFTLLAFGCASRASLLKSIDYKEIPFNQLESSIASVTENGHGFIVKAYVMQNWVRTSYWEYDGFKISDKPFTENDNHDIIYMTDFNGEDYWKGTGRIFEQDRQYTVYIAALKKSGQYHGVVTKIEGLRTTDEIQAEAEAKDEAANKYDPSKFVVVPSNFRPADYGKADLFDAVAESQKLAIDNTWGIRGVSDVVFVSQDGIYITFKTADNAISQTMTVDSRTNLKPGQKVRVYYVAYRIKDWHVDAIERL